MAKRAGRKKRGTDTTAEQSVEGRAIEVDAKKRRKLITECAQALNEIDDERSELNERAGEIRKRLKDAKMDVEAVQLVRRKMRNTDEAAFTSFNDGYREALEALAPGQTIDMFRGTGTDPNEETEEAFGGSEDPARPRFQRSAKDLEPVGSA